MEEVKGISWIVGWWATALVLDMGVRLLGGGNGEGCDGGWIGGVRSLLGEGRI